MTDLITEECGDSPSDESALFIYIIIGEILMGFGFSGFMTLGNFFESF